MDKLVFIALLSFALPACAQSDVGRSNAGINSSVEREKDPRDSASVGSSMRGGTDLGAEAEKEEEELRKKQN